MKIPLKAKVICKDGEYGSVKELLIDPLKEKVTHIVIENKHNGIQVIVSLNNVEYTSDSVVTINLEAKVIDDFTKFIVHEFISVPASESKYAYWGADPSMTHSFTMFPYVIHDGKPVVEVLKEALPAGEQKLKKSMTVKDINGKHVGNVDELVINAETEAITHIVMRKGHLFGKKEISVPNLNITKYGVDCIQLNLNEDDISNLPEVIINRTWN